MTELFSSFVSKTFLRSVWDLEFTAFKDTAEETALLQRLMRWTARKDLRETSAEAAFIEEFFRETWGYAQTGQSGSEAGSFTLWPKMPIAGSGATGGVGAADLAIGHFHKDDASSVPQVLCEFKDIRSGLDAPQKRKGNNRSPVRQCLDYLKHAHMACFPSDPILPTWGIVTDMNEFRLYWFDKGIQQSLRFVIQARDLFGGASLTDAKSEAARFDRFLFRKIFHRDTLVSPTGRSALVALINRQRFEDRGLELRFYAEYRALRERLYLTLLEHNGEGTPRYPGTRGRIVRLAQKLLDRCIFIFFCEDMGQTLAFPPKLLQDFLIERSNDPYFDPDDTGISRDLFRLFNAMNEGKAFGEKPINQFNGGLFAPDEDLERLHIPNSIFCQHRQGATEAGLYAYKETLLYLCASYNYAADFAQTDGVRTFDRDPSKSLGLYTLGRIFEQSITELEILEAEADGRPSVNKESKRKRDGVYYTPEDVVERIVDETLGPRLAEIKRDCGWPPSREPSLEALDAYAARLKAFTVLDPACGSGAFLITALRYLVEAWREVNGLRRQILELPKDIKEDEALIADILRSNIYGVDINPASTEITQLALWLHTARADKPLSSLGDNIREGNSLIGEEFYLGQSEAFYDAAEKERVNAFDWRKAFPHVFERGGFDAVVGNPPYVKLQNFRTVHSDMAEFLRDGRPKTGVRPYVSTTTGNFDLYLPFIEKGITLLNERGRLGYIAPSLWITNEYGEGLRDFIGAGRHLDRWIDYKSHQIFEEATTYTALQFFTKAANDAIRVADAPAGDIPLDPWSDPARALAYGKQEFGDRWLLQTGPERALIDRLYARCRRLDDPAHTANIFVGIQTSADSIYHLTRKGPGRYVCHPEKQEGKPKPSPYEVEIEDALMKPLVSGAEAKRYIDPETDTYLLFPYGMKDGRARLLDEAAMRARFPKAWAYLLSYETTLRARESGKMDGDDIWWGYNYPKNLDKQEIVKLIVPRLVDNLGCCVDPAGRFFLDNVDVGGVLVAESDDPYFISGVLNSAIVNFVFKRISKPFRGNYLSANKQFIAPLPIPPATADERDRVAEGALALQLAHTARRDTLHKIARRLSTLRRRNRPETWLFPDVRPEAELLADAPSRLDDEQKSAWAKQNFDRSLDAAHDALTQRLRPGAALSAAFASGELSFAIDGVSVIDRIFLAEAEGEFVVAQWKVLAATFAVTQSTDGRKLANALRKLAVPDGSALVRQIIDLEAELSALEAEIAMKEAAMNALVGRLYGLSEAEALLVQNGSRR